MGTPAWASVTDEQLLAAVASGDAAALAEVYDRHGGMMYGVALAILRDQREAEDALHDVFADLWQKGSMFDPARGKARTWLAIRIRSRALDVRKSARLANRADVPVEPLMQTNATHETSRHDHRVAVMALWQLPNEQRDLLALAYFEGLSCSEIAGRTGVPLGTVKSRLAAAMAKLRNKVAGQGEAGASSEPTGGANARANSRSHRRPQ